MYAVIYVPEFYLQAMLRGDGRLEKRPVVLIDETAKKPVVLQLTAAARALGICEGMSSTQALARGMHVLIKPRSAARENAATDALLQCAYSFSPAIEATAEGVCTLDLAGLPNLQYDELGAEMLQRLGALNLQARVGIGENPWLALLAARAAGRENRESHECCRVVTDSMEFLNALPIDSIAPMIETLCILKKWGIHTVGQFVALGKEPLANRLGPEALELHERATASATRPLKLVRPPDTFEESVEFEHEIETIEPLLFVLRRFLEQLLLRLEMMYWVARELRLELQFESGAPYDKMFCVPAPTSNIETLFRMLHTHLETLRTEHPIVGLRLSATPGRSINHQFGLFESVLRDPNHFHETLARLGALLGADRVGTPVLEESYRADAFRMEPHEIRMTNDEIRRKREAAKTEIRFSALGIPSDFLICHLDFPRGPALHRFRPPIEAHVEVAKSRPIAIACTVVQGAIRDARGPWRSSGQWWDAGRWGRDEWDVQAVNGRFYRLCRQAQDWFVEGIYD
ncbi:MAG: DNA polymerase Y family protein [Verrucomicrobia subdivision 3 bacterium]|nr:DNA polymerase Y family protein [Limisphaerales bacterium]